MLDSWSIPNHWSDFSVFQLGLWFFLFFCCWLMLRKEGSFNQIFSFYPIRRNHLFPLFVLGVCLPLLYKYGVGCLIEGDFPSPGGHVSLFSGRFEFEIMAFVSQLLYWGLLMEVFFTGIFFRRLLSVTGVVAALLISMMMPFFLELIDNLISAVWLACEGYGFWFKAGFLMWPNSGLFYLPVEAGILGCVYLLSRSVWSAVLVSCASIISGWFASHWLDFIVLNGMTSTACLVLVLLGIVAICFVYLYKTGLLCPFLRGRMRKVGVLREDKAGILARDLLKH